MISALILFGLMAADPASATSPDGAVYSNQRTFRIPLDLAADEREGLTAVRLYVSEDMGESWVRYNDGDPALDIITFRASHDGEYWFTIALVQQDGRQIPEDVRGVEPGLKVVVDSAKPNLTLKAIRNRAGRQGVRWTLDDPHVVESSFRLAAWDGNNRKWIPYDIRHPEENLIWFGEGENYTKLQATVLDLAGNSRSIEIEVVGQQFSKRDVESFALGSAPSDEIVPVSATMAERDSNQVLPATSVNPEPPVDATICSSHQVVVNYVVENSARGTPLPVELWGSRDRGRTWRMMSVDVDGASPIEAVLDADGVWGLRIIVRENPEPTPGPAPGTTPEMFINVDTTPPDVSLEQPTFEGGRVVIRWNASDTNLDEQPIDLLMSEAPGGPWKSLGVGLPNSGQHSWDAVGDGAHGQVYIRVEARDRARHVGFAHAKSPVALPGRSLFERAR